MTALEAELAPPVEQLEAERTDMTWWHQRAATDPEARAHRAVLLEALVGFAYTRPAAQGPIYGPHGTFDEDVTNRPRDYRRDCIVEDTEFLISTGVTNLEAAARRLWMKPDTLEQNLHRAGRRDLISRLHNARPTRVAS